MYIGIDDSGDFKNEESFFTAVLFRPSEYPIVEKSFKKWERYIRKICSIDGEVKGSKLPPAALLSFMCHFILNGNFFFQVNSNCVEGAKDAATKRFCSLQREMIINGMKEGQAFYLKRDKGKSKISNEFSNYKDWFAHLKDHDVLKSVVLSHTMIDSINASFPLAIKGGFDKELSELQIYIDECFISKQDITKTFWRDLVRNFLWQETYKNPLIFLDTWKTEGHPFIKKFLEEEDKDGKVVFSPKFKETINFYKSKEQSIIRIADICGTIIRKRRNSLVNSCTFSLLNSFFVHNRFHKLLFTNKKADIPNPYTMKS